MGKASPREREAFAALDALYARLPAIACKRKCGIACGPVPLTDLEARRLQRAAHQKPRTITVTMRPPGEAVARPVERCVYLRDEQTCSVYQARPLICRAWGLVKLLSCPHGCVPDRWVSDIEYFELARAVERLGGGRALRTCGEGLVDGGEAYEHVAARMAFDGSMRTAEQIDADAERTRSLRAIFGGRIIAAVQK